MWYLENKIPEGKRNNALFIAALKAISNGFDVESLVQKAISVDGLSEQEARRTVESARRYAKPVEHDPVAFIDRLFIPIDNVCLVERRDGRYIDHVLSYDGAVRKIVDISKDNDSEWFFRINPSSGNSDRDIERYEYTLIESDQEPLERQFQLLEFLKPCVVEAHYSGSKSLHILVNINANSIEQYKEDVSKLHKLILSKGYRIDKATKNPSRMSRLPYTTRGVVPIDVCYISEFAIPAREFIIIQQLPPQMRSAGLPRSIYNVDIQSPPEVLVEGVMRCGHKAIVSGSAKVGKSMAMLWLASALSNGGEWFNCKCRRSRVLYVNVEIDDYTIRARAEDMTKSGIDCGEFDIWNLRGRFEHGRDVISGLGVLLKNKGYDVVILDPVYLVLDGDESNAEHTKWFLNAVDRIIVNSSASFILVHHFAKGPAGQRAVIDRASGSSNFARWADAFITLSPLETNIRNSFRLNIISRSLLSPEPTEWTLQYPKFHKIEGKSLRVCGESYE